VVEGTHDIGAKLGAMSRGSDRDQSGCSQWLSDDEQGRVWGDAGAVERAEEEERGALHDGVLLL
jgi:hypothetical protein